MHERKHNLSTSHHLKNLKQQNHDRSLIELVIGLIEINDHDTLAYIARTSGIPPQLRHIVWPILLKYHPMCISPNILSNIVTWDPTIKCYRMILDTSSSLKTSDKKNDKAQESKIDTLDTAKSKSSSKLQGPIVKQSVTGTDKKEKDTDQDNDDNDEEEGTDKVDAELIKMISHDLRKYFKLKLKEDTDNSPISTTSFDSQDGPQDSEILTIQNEYEIVEALKDAIIRFLNKWSKVFKYESGLAWIALGLAEWFPPIPVKDINHKGPIVLSGKKNSHVSPQAVIPSGESNDTTDNSTVNITVTNTDVIDSECAASNTNNHHHHGHHKQHHNDCACSLTYLYNEYPLNDELQDKLPKSHIFQFDELLERLLLVILHSPDCEIATKNIIKDFPSKSSDLTNYFPILSGGDLSFQFQLFFKIFASILPELYQPLNDESSLQPNSMRSSWLYWLIKCSGARTLQRQDRARIWEILLGWRPKPKMDAINFFLNYNNNKIFNHIYKAPVPGLSEQFLRSRNIDPGFMGTLTKNDPFWFPDLNSIDIGSKEFPYDYNVFKELLIRNKYDQITTSSSTNSDGNSLAKALTSSLSSLSLSQQNNVGTDNCYLPMFDYSYIHPHIQLIFIYIAVLQYNEFKLLEFEETEILEFLNNLPMFSKSDDFNFKNLYLGTELNDTNAQNNSHVEQANRRRSTVNGKSEEPQSGITTRSSSSSLSTMSGISNTNTNTPSNNVIYNSANTNMSSHMLIELGNDAKASHSFNDLLNIAGDIWRKWLWKELEESSNTEIE